MVPVGAKPRDQESGTPVGGGLGLLTRRHSISKTEGHTWVDDIFMKTQFRMIPRTCRRTIRARNHLHPIPENDTLVIKTFRSPLIQLRTVMHPEAAKMVRRPSNVLTVPAKVQPQATVQKVEVKGKKTIKTKFWNMLKLANGPKVKGTQMMDTSLLNFV